MSKLTRRSLLKAFVAIGSLGTVVLGRKDAKASNHRIFWATKPGEIAVCPNKIVEDGDPVETLLRRLDMLFRVHESTVNPQRDIERVTVRIERTCGPLAQKTRATTIDDFRYLYPPEPFDYSRSRFQLRLTVEFRQGCSMKAFVLTHPGIWYHQHKIMLILARRFQQPIFGDAQSRAEMLA